MTSHFPAPFDIQARARKAMQENGFDPDFDPAAQAEAKRLYAHEQQAPSSDSALPAGMRDLRDLLWSSIDNDESRDLDQVEVAMRLPEERIRVLVGIADVDALVKQDTSIDQHAATNTTSVYTGVHTFAMLPELLSNDLTSLQQDAGRAAIIIDMTVDVDGKVVESDVYGGLLRNHARLTYNEVGAWLEGRGSIPRGVAHSEGMEGQIRLQNEVAQRMQAQRRKQGALEFETVEARPQVQNGQVVALTVPEKNAATYLIENFMVTANGVMASFLEASGLASIQRVVRSPERWPRICEIAAQLGDSLPSQPDPKALADFMARRKAADSAHYSDLALSIVKLLGPGQYALVRNASESVGHFGLAVRSYTHSTAPNRRFADLVTQRLLKAAFHKAQAPYTHETLETIALRCTEREGAARKVERLMRKVAAAAMLHDRVGQTFPAIVTGAKPNGTYVRVVNPPVEGRLLRGEQGVDVGDKLTVRLTAVDPERGFIDFERVG